MPRRIQLRRDTAANWTAANPVLASGEAGYEVDTKFMKLGDGSTSWVSLAYFGASVVPASVTDASVATGANIAQSKISGLVSGLSGKLPVSGAGLGGSGIADQTLKEWTVAEAYQVASVTLDGNNNPTTATVTWPDGSSGTYTALAVNSTWLLVDSYRITHVASGKTVTQPTVTRNGAGVVTTWPALTVA